MQLSPILSPDGRPMFSAGGRHAWKVFAHRGFVISLEWVGQGNKCKPCMVIWPESNVFVAGEGAGMWVISRNAIVDFVGFTAEGKCTGYASEHCLREAREALPVLGKDPADKFAHGALVECVIKGADELVHMPVAPKDIRAEFRGETMWDVKATIKETGKVINESEV